MYIYIIYIYIIWIGHSIVKQYDRMARYNDNFNENGIMEMSFSIVGDYENDNLSSNAYSL